MNLVECSTCFAIVNQDKLSEHATWHRSAQRVPAGQPKRSRTSRQAKESSRPTLVRISDAVDILGVTERTVREWIATGRLPAYRLGSQQIRLNEDDVYALLRQVPTAWPRGIANLNTDPTQIPGAD